MALIQLDRVSVDLPVYSANSRSLKAKLLPSSRLAAGPRHQILVHALREISCEFQAGDHVALVGRNGAGKSTLLSVLAGIYEPAYGRVRIEGRIAALLDMSLGMEDDATGHENSTTRGRLLGMSSAEIAPRMAEIIDFAGLGEHTDLPLRTYSKLPTQHRMQAILLLLGAMAILPMMDAIAKHLSHDMSLWQITWARFTFHVLWLAPAFLARHRLRELMPARAGLQVLRGLCLTASTFLFFGGVAYMPIADTLALSFVSP